MDLSLSILVSLGGIVASVASAFAIVRTKVTHIEEEIAMERGKSGEVQKEIEALRTDTAVQMAILKSNQDNHDKLLADMKLDIKTILSDVQDVKEALIKVKKGE